MQLQQLELNSATAAVGVMSISGTMETTADFELQNNMQLQGDKSNFIISTNNITNHKTHSEPLKLYFHII